MITACGTALIKRAMRVEDAMSFVTDRIRRPGPPQTLFVPPTRKKKVDENGNILKPLAGCKNRGELFGKFNPKFLGVYADDFARAVQRKFSNSGGDGND